MVERLSIGLPFPSIQRVHNMIPMMMTAGSQVAASAEGELWTWGKNDHGQLGHGGTTNVSSPVQVGARTDWVQVTGSFRHTVGRTSDGKIWSWGLNSYGQLGLGDTTDRSSPVQIGTDTDWTFIVGSRNWQIHAIKGGKLFSWGKNHWGQLGDGTTTNRSSPVQIGSETTWTWASGGSDTLHAIREGKLFSCGRGINGGLGHGNTTYLSSPTQVGAQTDWAQVHSSLLTTMAVKTTGKAYVWGYNYLGSLGKGTHGDSVNSPVQLGSLTNWYAADHVGFGFGGNTMMTIKTDGTLWTSGQGAYGAQGVGDTTNRSSPVQVGSLTTWLKVATTAIAYSNAAIDTDGKAWFWGRNNFGQLGHGNTTNLSSPVQLGSLTTWLQLFGGFDISHNHAAGIKTPS